jgi:hypothetical protein
MTDTITCPGCGRRLVLPAGIEADLLSCPKCLAQIPNPRRQEVPAAAGIQTELAPARPVVPTCPFCEEAVEPSWRFCPNCNAPLREPRRTHAAPVDDEVRKDTRNASGCIIFLAVLGGVGSFLVLMTWLKFAGSDAGAVGEAFLIFFCVLALAAVVAIVQLARGKTATAGKVVVGTLATFGGLILVWFAFLVFLFIVCLVNPPKFH